MLRNSRILSSDSYEADLSEPGSRAGSGFSDGGGGGSEFSLSSPGPGQLRPLSEYLRLRLLEKGFRHSEPVREKPVTFPKQVESFDANPWINDALHQICCSRFKFTQQRSDGTVGEYFYPQCFDNSCFYRTERFNMSDQLLDEFSPNHGTFFPDTMDDILLPPSSNAYPSNLSGASSILNEKLIQLQAQCAAEQDDARWAQRRSWR